MCVHVMYVRWEYLRCILPAAFKHIYNTVLSSIHFAMLSCCNIELYSSCKWKFAFNQCLSISPTSIRLSVSMSSTFLYSMDKRSYSIHPSFSDRFHLEETPSKIHSYCHKWQHFILFQVWVICQTWHKYIHIYIYTCVCTPHSLCPFIYWWTLEFPYLGYCKY